MLAGSQVGAYRVLQQIGAGGMGEVWLAEHTMLGRRAAIKVLHGEYSSRPEIVTRFFNEARAATAISDPGIVQIFDFGQHTDGSAYIVMELLDGEPLDKRLARCGRLAGPDALRIMRQVASTLGAAHARGIVHRDLKPENIFLVRDPEVPGGERAKILDFGIAKLGGLSTGVKTQTAAVMGTPTYMSPEQCRGAGQVDQRSDVYSLGCVLFHLLAGRPPFDAEGVGDIIAMHLRELAPRASTRAIGVPPAVDDLVARCLEKDPARRFGNGSELAVAIGALMGGSSPELASAAGAGVSRASSAMAAATPGMPTTLSSATGASAQTTPPRRSSVGLLAGVGAVAAIGVVIAIVASRGSSSSDQPAPATPPPPPTPAAPPPSPEPAAPPKPDERAVTTKRIAALLTDFVTWSKAHAGAPCPAAVEVGSDVDDGWGHALTITCTDQPSNQIIGVVSAGADGIPNTADDLASWQLGFDVTAVVRGARWVSAPPPAATHPDKAPRTKTTPAPQGKQPEPAQPKPTGPKPAEPKPKKPGVELDENGLPISR